MASLADMKQRSAAPNQENAIVPFEKKVEILKSKIPTLASVAPAHVNAKRIIHSAITQMSKEPKLAQCSPLSIYQSVSASIGLGLDIVGGQGYLVPRWNSKKRRLDCTFVPGWQGLVDLVGRSGRGTVFTGVIYRDQRYTYRDGARRDLEVHNESALDEPADITHVYAIGWIKGQDVPVIELWPIEKVRKHRDKYNEVGEKHYSFNNWEMYARKVPLLQVLKYMPKTAELIAAIEANDAADRAKEYTIDGEGMISIVDDEDGEEGAPADQNRNEPSRDPQTNAQAHRHPTDATDVATIRETTRSADKAEADSKPAQAAEPSTKKVRNAPPVDSDDDPLGPTPEQRRSAVQAAQMEMSID